MSFFDKYGNKQIGCGCTSTRSDDDVASGSPWPYKYIKKYKDMNESFSSKKYTFSKLKIPSWLCASSLESITESEIKELGKT